MIGDISLTFVVAYWSVRPEPEEGSVEEGTFASTKERTVEENTGDQGGGQNWGNFSSTTHGCWLRRKAGDQPGALLVLKKDLRGRS
jgi:hypothetical protein